VTTAQHHRICFVYDCLYPWTVGGAERWMTALARHAAEQGHDVTYITRRQWDESAPPEIDGVRVIAVSRQEDLYDEHGRRTIGEPIRFGWGVYRYLRAHAEDYDVIHVHATPLFGALGAAWAAHRREARVFVDWAEVWTRPYWTSYLGRVSGTVAWATQRACVRMTQHAFVPSQLHAQRLLAEGLNGGLTRLSGQFDGTIEDRPLPASADPIVVFAGRHIPEKGVLAIPEAIVAARRDVPELRARILGDGPDFVELQQRVAALGLQSVIDLPGFIATEDVSRAIGSATCMLLPSTREGYGLVVVEAAAKGTPSIVVAHPDNAAVELIDEGVNGFVADSQSPEDLAACIVKAVRGGEALRQSTWQWAVAKGPDMTVARSMAQVLAAYDTA
jgi:glycosyltransferase involved in cell wall biosynthesis